jgi:hypothetical protein
MRDQQSSAMQHERQGDTMSDTDWFYITLIVMIVSFTAFLSIMVINT